MPDDDDNDATEGAPRSLGSHQGFELIATRQANSWWQIMAISDVKTEDRTSAERSGLVVSDPSIEVAIEVIRERIDRWRGTDR
jgi:hypothetical protein